LTPAARPEPPPTTAADERIVLHTVAGDVVIALYPEVAPKTVEQMLTLARLGVLDTTHIGRVEPGFVLQILPAEDRLAPLTDPQRAALRPVVGEFQTRVRHRKGSVSMARADDPNSAVSSFSILLGDAPHLDGKYALFGHVVAGMDVVDRLAEVPRSTGTVPVTRLTVRYAEVLPADRINPESLEPARPLEQVIDGVPSDHLSRRATGLLTARCVGCHNPTKAKGKLDLTTAAGLHRVADGELTRRVTSDGDDRMPPTGDPLTPGEVGLLAAWVRDRGEGSGITGQESTVRDHWAFRPLYPVEPPTVADVSRVRSPVDRFTLAKSPLAPSAGPRTLARRLHFGLTGLPPTPEQIDAFTPAAIDQLLASLRFGETWGRFWLDIVRYADSNGFENDEHRPHAWPYRDWVIRAANQDLPFDQFVRWQIAGDELEPTNPDAVAATGFLAAGPLQTFAPRKRDRYDELDDIVSTTGAAFLGLTVGCARCHNHKHDPVTQREYYQLQAVFASAQRAERYLVPDGGAGYEAAMAPLRTAVAERDRYLDGLKRKARDPLIDTFDISDAEKALLRKPPGEGDQQASLIRVFEGRLKAADAKAIAESDDDEEYRRLCQKVAELESVAPAEPPKGLAVRGSGVTRAYFLERGDPNRERQPVSPGFLAVLSDGPAAWLRWVPAGSPNNPRSAFARWLTDVEHGAGRLLARVIVNRVWQFHFGDGLVRTPNDFGKMGDAPTHPELLDFLAAELIRNGWRLKPIHRLILTSATYQAQRPPRRLPAEAVRDAMLAVAGNLNPATGGPSVRPWMTPDAIFPTDIGKIGEPWDTNAVDGPATWRRSVYVLSRRSNPFLLHQAFDFPDTTTSCGRRGSTTVPTQALVLLNDRFVINQANRLADRVRLRTLGRPGDRVTEAFRLALGRSPTAEEKVKAERFVTSASLAELCHVLLMSNEFVYID
jgi:cyclophilin family peptidyl-prolyl cis-trans isomerase